MTSVSYFEEAMFYESHLPIADHGDMRTLDARLQSFMLRAQSTNTLAQFVIGTIKCRREVLGAIRRYLPSRGKRFTVAVEKILFSRSRSMVGFSDPATLTARVDAIVTQTEQEVNKRAREQVEAQVEAQGKRARPASLS